MKKNVTPSISEKMALFWHKDVVWDCPMSKFSTLRVGGNADAVVFPETVEELTALIKGAQRHNIPWWIIGRGSNILVADEGLPGVVVQLGRQFSGIERVAGDGEEVVVRADAGCSLSRLVEWCAEQELTGLEFAVGIPGSVGGAVVMNAGAWGEDISGIIASAQVLEPAGTLLAMDRDELGFSYRQWGGGKEWIVVSAEFVLEKGKKEAIRRSLREYTARRKAGQPQGTQSAGSFFKNPPGNAAGRLIEDAGLKGMRVGGAMVSRRHANFIVNTGTATARDILDLMHMVQEGVKQKSGILLEPEVHILGTEKSKN